MSGSGTTADAAAATHGAPAPSTPGGAPPGGYDASDVTSEVAPAAASNGAAPDAPAAREGRATGGNGPDASDGRSGRIPHVGRGLDASAGRGPDDDTSRDGRATGVEAEGADPDGAADTDEAERPDRDGWAARGERASAARTGRAQALRERYGTGPVPEPDAGPPSSELAAVPQQPARGAPPPSSSPTGRPGPGRRAGRHAATGERSPGEHTPPPGYRPRHAAPDAETERLARADIAAAEQAADVADAAPAEPTPVTGLPLRSVTLGGGETRVVDPTGGPAAPDRVRIVLAERRSPTRAVRTVAEIEQQTETGEFLLSNLMRAQLSLGVRLGLVATIVFGALPVMFLMLPALGYVSILGLVRVPWLILGFAPYPFLVALGWAYTHHAERNERDFAENVED